MARELDINITVNDGDAKAKLEGVDQATEKAASSAGTYARAQTDLEARTAKAAAAMGIESAELEKIRAQLAAGIDPKLVQTVGTDIPKAASNASAGLREVPKAASDASDGLAKLEGMAVRIVERMALLYALKGAFSFVEGLFLDAQKLQTVAAELDLTVESVQRLQTISVETSIPMAIFTGAIAELTKKIVTDNGGADKAVRDLGLSVETVKAQEAGQRFDTMAVALSSVTDNAKRAGLEVELFGTTKLDAAIKNYAELKKQADSVSQSLSTDQVDALARVAKGWDLAKTASHNYFAGIAADLTLAIKGNADGSPASGSPGASALAAIIPLLPPWLQQILTAGNGSTPQNNRDLNDANQRIGIGKAPAPPGAPGGLSERPPGYLDPADKDAWAAIQAIEKSLTQETERRIALEKEEVALQHDMFTKSLETAKLIAKEFEKQVAALAKGMDTAIVSEFEAKKRNAAALGFDVAGNRLGDPGAIGSPDDTYQKRLIELQAEKARTNGAADTSGREAEAYREYIAAVTKAAGATDNLAGKADGAAAAADRLKGKHDTAGQAADGLVNAFTRASSMMVPTAESLTRAGIIEHASSSGFGGGPQNVTPWGGGRAPVPWGGARATGGPVSSDASYLVGENGPEMFRPGQSGSISPNGSGVSIGEIHVHGNIDSRATADRYAQETATRLLRLVRADRKVQLGKA